MKLSPSSYAPDDAKISVQSLDFLHQGSPSPGSALLADTLALFSTTKEPSVAQIAALRKSHPREHLHAALAIARLQSKATGKKGKFPELPFVWSTPEALEQATGSAVARWKAQRFARLNPAHIFDLCSGIGGDTVALAEIAPTTAIDLSAVRLRCLEFNLQSHATRFPVKTRAADIRVALPTLPRDAHFHIDPARRFAGKRSPRYDDLIPGPDLLDQISHHFSGGAIKLSPAVDFDSLPPGHLELISHQGSVVQALLWIGTLAQLFPPGPAPNTRTVTILSNFPPYSLTEIPRPSIVPEALTLADLEGKFLAELDGALTRCALAPAFSQRTNLTPLTHDGGYALASDTTPSPGLTYFEMHRVIRYSEKRVAEALAQLPPTRVAPGPIEVKSRGRLPGLDTDHLQRLWSKASPHAHTVLLFQLNGDVLAVLATRNT